MSLQDENTKLRMYNISVIYYKSDVCASVCVCLCVIACVCYRPEMDTEWMYIREAVESNSMVLKGLIPDTQYQFVIRAVNVFGISPPSAINSPVRTLGESPHTELM